MHILAVSNQKGGSTKTATTLGLASAASARGLRVLLVDLDSQANLSTGVGIDPLDCATTVNEVLMETANPVEGIVATTWDHVDLMVGSEALANRESDAAMDIQYRLRNALSELGVREKWDLVLIDTPPFVGKLMANAMAAADAVIVATDASADGARGVSKIVNSVQRARRSFNESLAIMTIVIGRREHTDEQEFRENEMRTTYGELVARNVIPKRAAVADAHGLATPIHRMRGKGAFTVTAAYKDLFDELDLASTSTKV